jgi:uncharacterized protein (DUF1778 family)
MPEPKQTRKPPELRKDESIRIRVTAEQKEALTQAAQKDGQGLSSWLLRLGLREARKDVGS